MKKLMTAVIFLSILAVCLPAQAQPSSNSVLVYDLSVNSWSAGGSGNSWTAYRNRNRGHVLIDVSQDPNGVVNGINSATKIATSRSGGSKSYSESSVDFDFVWVDDPNSNSNSNEWVIVNSDSENGTMTMLRGRTRSCDIGNSDPNSVAPRLEGNLLGFIQNGSTSISSNNWSLRLNRRWTKNANREEQTLSQVRSTIRERYRQQGYSGVPEEEK